MTRQEVFVHNSSKLEKPVVILDIDAFFKCYFRK